MISAWWLVAATLGGAYLGVLLMALLQLSGSLPEPQARMRNLKESPH
jgi:hypothetical protein